ncbi:MAG: hypothetical protein R3E39_08190 [Anaerolineae bacterium]
MNLLTEDVGVGIIIDIGTAFFHSKSLDYFFDRSQNDAEQERRCDEFYELTQRQQGSQGTLLYKIGNRRMTCYFKDAPAGLTCATSGEMRINNVSYPSLYDYYKAKYP